MRTSDERAALVSSTDEYGDPDPWHDDSAGAIYLGRQLADALEPLSERKAQVRPYRVSRRLRSVHRVGPPIQRPDRRLQRPSSTSAPNDANRPVVGSGMATRSVTKMPSESSSNWVTKASCP